MMLEVVEEWLYKFALLISAGDGQDCGTPAVRAEGTGGNIAGVAAVSHITAMNTVWQTGGAFQAGGVVFIPAGRWIFVFSCKLTHTPALGYEDIDVECAVRISNGDNHIYHGGLTCPRGGSIDAMVTAFFDHNETNSATAQVLTFNLGRITITDCVFFAQAY